MRAPIADMSRFEEGDRIGACESPRESGTDGAEAEEADATPQRARAVAGGLKRVEQATSQVRTIADA